MLGEGRVVGLGIRSSSVLFCCQQVVKSWRCLLLLHTAASPFAMEQAELGEGVCCCSAFPHAKATLPTTHHHHLHTANQRHCKGNTKTLQHHTACMPGMSTHNLSKSIHSNPVVGRYEGGTMIFSDMAHDK